MLNIAIPIITIGFIADTFRWIGFVAIGFIPIRFVWAPKIH